MNTIIIIFYILYQAVIVHYNLSAVRVYMYKLFKLWLS